MKALELKNSLTAKISPIYFFKGEDFYLKSLALKAVTDLVDSDFKDFNLSVFDNLSDVKAVVLALETMPVMAELKVVVVKSCKGDETSIKALTEYAKQPQTGATLALVVEDDSLKQLYQYGEMVDCNKATAVEVYKLITDDCAAHGFEIASDAVRKLAELTGFDMGRISSELKKLYAFCDGEKLTLAAVVNLVAPDLDFQIFEITNAIVEGRNGDIIGILDSLLKRGERPSVLLGVITNQYRKMLHASLSDLNDADLAKCFGMKNSYGIMVARRLAKSYSQMTLKTIVDKLVELEYGFKVGKFSEDDALKFAVAYLLKKGA